MTAIIETKKLSKLYGSSKAVDEASFSINKGEVVGFVGLNGAGKSTTINILLGFQKPSAGDVSLFGEQLTLSNAYKSHRKIGFATGDMSLFDGMTGTRYLKFIARSHGTNLKTEQYKKLVQRFEPELNKKLNNLSRGNKQKIALIAAFMAEPELVILDEPSSGLDPLMQQHFIELVREEAAKGTTIFMSSHYLGEVVDVCSRILLIKQGKLVKDMPASDLEKTAAKLVRVVTKTKVMPPKGAELVEYEPVSGEKAAQLGRSPSAYTLQFVYNGNAIRLQEWLGTLPKLQDVTISDDSALTAFEELYQKEAE